MWYPSGNEGTAFILMMIAGFWGLAEASYNVITNSKFESFSSCRCTYSRGFRYVGVYGQMHSCHIKAEITTDETNKKVVPTGFSNYSLWKSVGSFVMASLAPLLVVQVILLILTFILTIAVIVYVIIEFILRGHLKPGQQYTSL